MIPNQKSPEKTFGWRMHMFFSKRPAAERNWWTENMKTHTTAVSEVGGTGAQSA